MVIDTFRKVLRAFATAMGAGQPARHLPYSLRAIRHATNVFGISSLQPLARADSATFYDNSDARATWTPGHADLQWPADTSPG